MKLFNFDIGLVLLAHIVALLISVSNVADSLKIISLTLAIGYTTWKWLSDYTRQKKEK